MYESKVFPVKSVLSKNVRFSFLVVGTVDMGMQTTNTNATGGNDIAYCL